MPTVKFFTLGCKVNQYDTQVIREQFQAVGYQEIDNGSPADICVINTCTVTKRADMDSLNIIRKAIRHNPKGKVIVTGCLTELDSDKIKEIKGVNLIIKNNNKHKILEHLFLKFPSLNPQTQEPANPQTRKCANSLTRQRANPQINTISYFKGHTRAFLKIQDGCDNFCSYCKVPLVRGLPFSKPLPEILYEADKIIKSGVKEIVLSGICLGKYGKDLSPKISLVEVIRKIEKIEGLFRIRLSSIEALDVNDELIGEMALSKKICRHLHIPLQSGDNSILREMNRDYSADYFLDLICKLRNRIPDIAITTDVIVGFPGETDEGFMNTIRLIQAITPLKVHIFAYSPRPQTPAFKKYGYLRDEMAIKERLAYIKKIANECAADSKRRFLNKEMEVLVEGRNKDKPDFWEGYTDNYIKVLFKGNLGLKNQFVNVKLTNAIQGYVIGKQIIS